jgi:hypothetical protein
MLGWNSRLRSMTVYTHGHHESVLRSHRWRTLENSAAYLLPHLSPDFHVLDVGCGPGTITGAYAIATAAAALFAHADPGSTHWRRTAAEGDDGEYAADLWVGEGGIDVGGTCRRCRSDLTRRRVLDRDQPRQFGESTHHLFMHLGKRTSRRKRG